MVMQMGLRRVLISNNTRAACSTDKHRRARTSGRGGQLPSRWRIAAQGRTSRIDVSARVIMRIARSGAAGVTVRRSQNVSGQRTKEVAIFVLVDIVPLRFVILFGISPLSTRCLGSDVIHTVASAGAVLGRAGSMTCGDAKGAEMQGGREEGNHREPVALQWKLGSTEQLGQCRSASDLGPARQSCS